MIPLNLPNVLTLMRIVAVPVVVVALLTVAVLCIRLLNIWKGTYA